MSDLAIIIILLLFVSLVIFGVTTAINRNRRTVVASRIARTPWRIEEHVSGGYWRISTVRPGESNEEGAVKCNAPDFDEQVEEARINAELRLHTLNRALPR